MKSFRTSSFVSLVVLSSSVLAGFFLPACGDSGKSDEGGDDLTASGIPDDTFMTNVLANAKCTIRAKGKTFSASSGGICPTKLSQVLDALEKPAPTSGDAGAAAPARGPNVFVVAEMGDKPDLNNTYRFVLSGGAGVAPEELYVASFASGRGAPESGVEVMAWSKKIQAFVFWKESGGVWERVGDGTMVPSQAKGAAPAFACAGCHTSGGPLMKELHDSWANWTSSWFTVVNPNSPDANFNRMFSKVTIADTMERHIVASEHLHVKGRVERAKAENKLKGIATQLFCDVGEGTLIAAHSRNSSRFGDVQTFSSMLPGAFVVSALFRTPRTGSGSELGLEGNLGLSLPSIDSLSIDPAAYSSHLKSGGQKINGQPGDSIFPMNGPEKSYADNDAVLELLRNNLVDRDFVADVLMTDFTTPTFSKFRCALATSLPESWTSPADLKAKLAANLASSTARGAKGLAARLQDPADLAKHTATLEAYGKACLTRRQANGSTFTGDTLVMLSQRRAEFRQAYGQLIESDALLPTDNLNSIPGARRFSGTTCELEASTAKFVGEDL